MAKKDELTGNEIVELDFFGKKLYPPKKLKQLDAGREIEKLLMELDRCTYTSKYSDKKGFSHYSFGGHRGGGEQKQPCMVKMFYTSDKQTHREFLRNYMKQENKKEVTEKPSLFNGEYDNVPEEVLVDYEENKMVDLGFKFIISPESQKVPMKQLVRQYVKALEKASGYSFTWFSAVHTDTGHTHAHLLINGVDKKTKEEIHFPRELIKDVLRKIGSDICTSLVGSRSQEQIEESRKKLPYAKRWTVLDERIANHGGYVEFNKIKVLDNGEFEAEKTVYDDVEIQRLNFLVEMGFAVAYNKKYPPKYYLEKDWKNKLKSIGRYNTYLDARSKLRFTPYYNLEIYNSEMGQIDGVISQIYNMDDEYVWNNAVVIENRKLNKAWYVPTKVKLKEDDMGKIITVKSERNQKGTMRPVLTIHSH